MENLAADPLVQFEAWWKDAVSSHEPQPDAIALATSSRDGRPSLRMVLFKGMLRNAFSFYTNYESPKARELIDNPQAAIVFYWQTLQRQVRVSGSVEKTTEAESRQYFQTRPRGSQLAAATSEQSRPVASRADLEHKYEELEKKFAGQEVVCPASWGGFRLVPQTVEFWIGKPNRLHERHLYEKSQNGWNKKLIQP
jgi:pyridoxamine 5'-phosphate oxidase